jgi:hypothetical protein
MNRELVRNCLGNPRDEACLYRAPRDFAVIRTADDLFRIFGAAWLECAWRDNVEP